MCVSARRGAPLAAVGALLLSAHCAARSSSPAPLTADVPLHLESHLDAATIEGSAAPVNPPRPVEWQFDQPQPAWTVAVPFNPTLAPASLSRTEDALRVTLAANSTYPKTRNPKLRGYVAIDLPDWRRDDWAHVVVRARTAGKVSEIGIGFNRREGVAKPVGNPSPFRFSGESTAIIRDGSTQTYLLRTDWWNDSGSDQPSQQPPWQRLGLSFVADEPASIDILSVSVIPKEANYTSAPVGSRSEVRGRVYRSALYTHAPGTLAYRVRIPEGGRLDVGLGVLRTDAPVTFRVTAAPDAGETVRLFEERVADTERWTDRSIDVSSLAGRIVTLTLATDAERLGTVALWGAPTVRGTHTSSSTSGASSGRPNVVFYVIDGGGADFMSVYGYHRRTTPTLERLASEGAVFERVYSNASWTRPSTASFMTGLQNSVMGGLRVGMTPTPVPEQAVTMAEHMHRAGYQTAVFTANPNAGTLSNLQRGVDLFREDWDDFSYAGAGRNHKESSRFLNEGFWKWRQEFPGEPYWVHFQSTDVHEEFPAVSPFAGLFVGPDDLRTWKEWNERLRPLGGHGNLYSDAWKKTGISRTAFFSIQQGLYDETMAHNDYQLGRLVDRLKATGAWDRTLLVVGADHSTSAAMDDMGLALSETLPPRWGLTPGGGELPPMFRPTVSRVPLIVVWPGHIRGGQRFAGPVSMIDVLPTLLDLVGLPPADASQGQSLAPLLRGTTGWQPRPVILDEFNVRPQTGKLGGMIEIVDGEWGASLEINPDPDRKPEDRRPVPLLLYDLWKDPMCLQSVHEQHPDLVAKYTKMLTAQFEAHQALAQRFTGGHAAPLTPAQLRTLRSLGYIR